MPALARQEAVDFGNEQQSMEENNVSPEALRDLTNRYGHISMGIRAVRGLRTIEKLFSLGQLSMGELHSPGELSKVWPSISYSNTAKKKECEWK